MLPIYGDLMFFRIAQNCILHQQEIGFDFRLTKKQTNKTAGFHFREDHGLAEMSILGQFANKWWIYSGDLWMIVSSF